MQRASRPCCLLSDYTYPWGTAHVPTKHLPHTLTMVTRKPIPAGSSEINITAAAQQQSHSAPYPTTPIEPATSSNAFKASPARDGVSSPKKLTRRDSDGSIASNGTWDDSDDEVEDDGFVAVPQPLNIRPSSQDGQAPKEEQLPAALRPGGGNVKADLPAVLRPGPTAESGNPWASESRNPYKQKAVEGNHTGLSGESSELVWQQATPSQPSQAPPPPPPVELPNVRTPAEELSKMSLDDRNPTSPTGSYMTAEVLPVPHKGMPPYSPVAPTSTGQSSDSQAFPSTNPWSGSEGQSAPSPGLPPKDPLSPAGHAPQQTYQLPYPNDQDYAPPPGPPPTQNQQQYQPPAGPPIGSFFDREEEPASATSSLVPPMQPDDSIRDELYQVKHIRWYDASSETMRSSPIMTQNANGPCPLLALVNAIVLSTPADLNTPLVDALSDNGNRSQISLGLLLDALFDELTSGRRGETAQRLPDVTELYAFLLALHTGMNVNPRFITPALTPRGSLDGHASAVNNIHPTDRSQSKAGAFEETKEMQLYSTLNIPLIHGWIPPPSTPAYDAFARNAQTFEEAQNIQFLESDYLALPQLDFQQQQMLDDIRTIKHFLSNWPTQLTEYGLEAISNSLQPGQIAILFRNDHFSTVYKEPRGGALMTLVTDTGYSAHEEIVWESLVDVNGAASEMFSGDFRTVSHGSETERSRRNGAGGGVGQWENAQRRHQEQENGTIEGGEAAPPLPGPRPTQETPSDSHFPMSSIEQEDHDLALALQLQEEEEDQQRQAESRRRRERELSEQFLSNDGNERPPAIPPRRGSGRRTSLRAGGTPTRRGSGRPAVSRPGEDDAEAPPTYEQSRTDRVLRPGETPPSPMQYQQQQQQGGEWGRFGNSPQGRGRGRGGYGPRGGGMARPGVNQAANVRDAEERCVLM